MSIPVWIWPVEYPVQITIKLTAIQIDLGGGVIKTVQHEIPFTNYDGTGQSQSRKGTMSFTFPITRKNFEGDEKFKEVMRFLLARKFAGDESFYFYNPAEKNPPDPTGDSLVGRYLVKHLEDISATMTKLRLYDFSNLTFTEDRS